MTSNKKLALFDLDDTLFWHEESWTKLYIFNKDSGVRREISSERYNSYKLEPNERFEYCSLFKDADHFIKTARPIVGMHEKFRQSKQNEEFDICILTARETFTDHKKFLNYLKKFDIDCPVHMAGDHNVGKAALNKVMRVHEILTSKNYDYAILYDDSEENIEHFLDLKKRYPNTAFAASHVFHDSMTNITRVHYLERV